MTKDLAFSPPLQRSQSTNTTSEIIQIEALPIAAPEHNPVLTTSNLPNNVVDQEDPPPNGGYGWVVCLCVFLMTAHTWGILGAWGIFLAHYLSESTFPNATRLQYALIGGLSISQATMISPLVSIISHRVGTKTTLLFGTALFFVALLGASFSTQIWHLFLTQGFCFGWGMGFLYVTTAGILPQWFSTRRSLAVGLAASGMGVGGLIYNLVAGAAVASVGINWTYRILAFCALTANVVCSMLIKDRNKSVQPIYAPFNLKECTRIEVILLTVWGTMTELGYVVLVFSIADYAISIGLTPHQGSVVGAILHLGLAIARPAIGYYSDTIGRLNIATLCTALCGVLVLCLWVPAKSYALLLVFALLAGTVAGTYWTCIAPVTVEVVGLKRLPSCFGMIILILAIPATFAEPIALQIVEARGYLSCQIFVGFMYLLAGVSTWLLRSWKVNDVEMEERKKRRQEQEWPIIQQELTRKEKLAWLTPKKLFFIGWV